MFSPAGMLPENAGELAEKIKRYFALLTDGENFRAWGEAILKRVGTAGRAVMVALPCLLIVIVLIRRLYRKGNTRHNRDTMFLKAFKRAVCWGSGEKGRIRLFWLFAEKQGCKSGLGHIVGGAAEFRKHRGIGGSVLSLVFGVV